MIWRVIRNWKKNRCLIRGTWRRKEKKDILTNKMLQQQRKLSKQQPTVHWRIFGLSWPFLFSQSVALPGKKMKEKQVSWWCSLKPGFACFNLLWLDSATTPNLSEKTDHSFWILFSLDLWCSNRFNYTYYSSNCPMIWCLTYG